MCGCEHVATANRLHCLQSSHFQPNANVEGFAHFFATRVFNDKSADALFRYYKEYRRVTFLSGLYVQSTLTPPVPLAVGTPFTSPTTTGWVRRFCPGTDRASEYDWTTFLWSVNGSAASSEQSSMADLLSIFNAAKANFRWSVIATASDTRFGQGSAQANRFRELGDLNGVTY